MDPEVLTEARRIATEDLEGTGILCTIRTIILVDLPSGGQEETELDLGPYPCRVQQDRQPIEQSGGDRVIARQFWWVVLPWDVVRFSKTASLRVLGEDGVTTEYGIVEDNQGRTERLTTVVFCATTT